MAPTSFKVRRTLCLRDWIHDWFFTRLIVRDVIFFSTAVEALFLPSQD